MNRLNFVPAIGVVLGVLIGVIVLVSVGTSVASGTAASISTQVAFTNASMTPVNNSAEALPAFLNGVCNDRGAVTALTNGNASVTYVAGTQYSVNANDGLVSYLSINTATNGTTALATGTCFPADTTTATIVNLVPLFVALAALAYVAFRVLM